MLIDHFLINDEIEMLVFRMEVLNSYVSEFHVLESHLTHSNKPKKLYLTECLHKLPFKEKIKVSVFTPEYTSYGSIERESRNELGRLASAYPSDVIQMLSDIDEIPSIPDKIETPSVSCMDNFYYDFNHKWKEPHYGTVFFLSSDLKKITGQELRDNRSQFNKIKGGWHCSCFCGVEKTVNKLNSFSHIEFQDGKTNTREWVAERIEKGLDIVERDLDNTLSIIDYPLPPILKRAYLNFKKI